MQIGEQALLKRFPCWRQPHQTLATVLIALALTNEVPIDKDVKHTPQGLLGYAEQPQKLGYAQIGLSADEIQAAMVRAPQTQFGKFIVRMSQVGPMGEQEEIHPSTDDVVAQILGTWRTNDVWHRWLGSFGSLAISCICMTPRKGSIRTLSQDFGHNLRSESPQLRKALQRKLTFAGPILNAHVPNPLKAETPDTLCFRCTLSIQSDDQIGRERARAAQIHIHAAKKLSTSSAVFLYFSNSDLDRPLTDET